MTRFLFLPLVLVLLLLSPVARADNNVTVVNKLTNDDVYVAPSVIAAGHAGNTDKSRLQRAVDDASKRSVPVKVALLTQYPRNLHNPHDAADRLRNFIDFSGVLVLVSPRGVGVSSDYLSNGDSLRIERQVTPACSSSYTACAVTAIQASVPLVQSEQAAANRNVAVFWAVAVIIFGILVAALVLIARRKQEALMASRDEGSPTELPAGPAPESR